MLRSFQIVDFKVFESEFFLSKLKDAIRRNSFFDQRAYVSAFLSASRSITFTIQASLSDLPDFEDWYQKQRAQLSQNQLAQYFLKARNLSQKVGYYPNLVAKSSHLNDQFFSKIFDITRKFDELNDIAPKLDLFSACKEYFVVLLQIVYDCYRKFGTVIDPKKYFTRSNFQALGKTIDDLEAEFGFPRGWTDIPESNEDKRWKVFMSQVHPLEIDNLFIGYLDKSIYD